MKGSGSGRREVIGRVVEGVWEYGCVGCGQGS